MLVAAKCLLVQIVSGPYLFTCVVCSYPLNDAAETVNEIGSSMGRVMGGTSGILYYSIPLSFLN